MKRLVSGVYQADGSPITAMATINPALCRKYGIEVEVEQRDEGSVPHVHVYHDSSRNPKNCSYIRLDVAEYSPHHKQNKPLSKKQKDQFISIMTSVWPKHYHEAANGEVKVATGYLGAVDTWVECYEDGSYEKFKLDQNGDPIIPDYSNL